MFNYIKGYITEIYPDSITVDVNDIGYLVKTPSPYSFKVGEKVLIYTHMYIREDILDLYGFKTIDEKTLFLDLLSVRGIGPKTALAIIAHGDIQSLREAITNNNVKYLQSFPGIGQKSSSQIILDLKGKLIMGDKTPENPVSKDVKEALKSLGYSASEIKHLDSFINSNLDKPIDKLIKECLTKLL